MKLPDEECSRVATSGWLTELEKLLFDGGPNLMIEDATVRMLIGALRFERKRSAEIMSDLVNADKRAGGTPSQFMAQREADIREGFEIAVHSATLCHEATCLHDAVESHLNWTDARLHLEDHIAAEGLKL